MMMGTLSVAQAGIGRIGSIRTHSINRLTSAFFPIFWGSTVAAAFLLWLVKLAMTRRWDRDFASAIALFATSGLLSSYVAMTNWWLQLALHIRR
jgi:hypothetical protein